MTVLDNGHELTDHDVEVARLIVDLDRRTKTPTAGLISRIAKTPLEQVRRTTAVLDRGTQEAGPPSMIAPRASADSNGNGAVSSTIRLREALELLSSLNLTVRERRTIAQALSTILEPSAQPIWVPAPTDGDAPR